MEESKRNTDSSKIHRKKWSDAEISKYFLIEFFKAIPESPEEKDIKEVKLLRILLSYYDKCCELLEKECENSKTLKIARNIFNWNKELNSKCSIEEVTYATETLLLEYEICVHDVKEREMSNTEMSKKEIKDATEMDVGNVDPEKSAESKDATSLDNNKSTIEKYIPRSKPECLEVLIGMFFHVDRIRAAIKQEMLKLSKDCSNSTEETSDMETEDSKKDSLPEKHDSKTDSMEKRLNNRMEFITNMKLLIRAALLLFMRLNPMWMVPDEEKVSGAVGKREAFAKIEMASTDSSASSDNPPSVTSSSDNPSSVASCSDNPPSVASTSENTSSGTEVYELSSVGTEAQDQSSMDVDP